MKSLKNKLVYVTGGSSGIGLETARQLCRLDAQLVLISRNQDKLDDAVRSLEKDKSNVSQRIATVAVDVSDYKKVESILSKAIYDHGIPDVLIANAGIGNADYFENMTYQSFDQVIKTNLYGVRNVITTTLPTMKKKGGKIVIIASMAGISGMIGYTAYGTSKFALVGFAECLRPELKRMNIDVSLVCPPEVETPLIVEEAKTLSPESRALKSMAGLLTVEQAGKAVVKAVKGNQFLTIPGVMANATYLLLKLFPGKLSRSVQDFVIKKNSLQN